MPPPPQPLAGDVAAYAVSVIGIGGEELVFEEEDFDTGMRHNAMDHAVADADNDGMLDFKEFCKLIRDREEGEQSTKALRRRFYALDADGSGKVDMSEYFLWSLRDALIRSSQRVLDLFQQWDVDGSGSITRKELRKAVECMGFDARKADIDALFDELDGDGSGKVDYAELNTMLRQGAGSQADTSAAGAGRSPHVSPRSAAPKDRLGYAGNRRALKRNARKDLAGGRRNGPLAGVRIDMDGADGRHPIEQLRDALAHNSARVVDLFRAWDVDGDGQVDGDEFRQALFSLGVDEALRPHVDALFAAIDKDGSGSIEYKEMNRMLRKEAELDADLQAGAAGQIALESKNAHAARQVDLAAGRRRMGLEANLLEGLSLNGDGGAAAPADERGAPVGGAGVWDEARGAMIVEVLRKSLSKHWMRVRELFKSWDTNGDGLISRAEFIDAMRVLGLQASDQAILHLFRLFDAEYAPRLPDTARAPRRCPMRCPIARPPAAAALSRRHASAAPTGLI